MRDHPEFMVLFLSGYHSSRLHSRRICKTSVSYSLLKAVLYNTDGRTTTCDSKRSGRHQQLPPSQQQKGIYHTKLQVVQQSWPGLILLRNEEERRAASANIAKGVTPPALNCWFQWAIPINWHYWLGFFGIEGNTSLPYRISCSKLWGLGEDRNQAAQGGGNSSFLAPIHVLFSACLNYLST